MLNENSLWNAVNHRDAQWDGAFVYAVSSTGIYCRPTCPSRRPRRAGVRFFPTSAAAAAAGFRACKRCAPDTAAASVPQIDRVRRACALLAASVDGRLSLDRVAASIKANPRHLWRSFKQTLGISPRDYAEACRVGCLKAELRAGAGVAAATYGAGFGSGSRVYERAASTLGMTPAVYARGGAGQAVNYAIVASPLGRLLVAATARGICSVKLGERDEALERGLREEFPAAGIEGSTSTLARSVRAILDSLGTGAPDPRLPLDVRATAFQRRVWRELQRIPRGTTRSYREIAARIGQPRAARAVARACASNPVAILVPCHRVVHQDGSLGGYHWGVDRKRALLENERSR